MSQSITEKIVQSHAVDLASGHEVRAGDMVTIRPRHVMTHDNTSAVLSKFRSIGATRVADPAQPVFTLDHNVQDSSAGNLAKYQAIEAFAREQGIVFHPAGAGIGHQLMVENGFVHPGSLVVASDSHSNMYGALAAVGTPVVRTDAAAIWATGRTWWQVPRTVKVVLEGRLRAGVVGKDVILALCGLYRSDEVLNAAVEFHGPGVAGLSISERMTIANMTTEWGALVGWFPFDETTARYLRRRASLLTSRGIVGRLTGDMISSWILDPPLPDADAEYAAEITLDLSAVSPQVTGPDTVSISRPVAEVAAERIRVDKAYLLSCVNSRMDDLAEAAEVVRGRRVAESVELYVAAASAEVQAQAEAEGIWQALLDAGAQPLPPGCGACIGLGAGLLEPGEVGISATNRNFKGRMGSRDAKAYLASPAVVAASALAGHITGPADLGRALPERSFRDLGWAPPVRPVAIRPGFPERIRGRVLLLPVDNLNTDGIYGKDVTYRDDLTPAQMAGHAMANYDPEFQAIAAEGDIIVAGANFGTGSSREQAATALAFRGIRMVIAASFSQTYLRNAFNNAFICLDSPELERALRAAFAAEAAAGRRTIPAGEIDVDFRRSVAVWRGVEHRLSPLGPAAQELVQAGGLEALIRSRLGG
ncbi:MAG TPA: homoaconitase [Thermoanaerobaculales bacterium]|nr:homoaconitase [Thermoanaerobaculales bacterium]HQN97477.1 homoaconitase [Thermoanaerobaculales bacterium]HQP44567.1 homoaconitase [Thermoanaerobaculales bacterium]